MTKTKLLKGDNLTSLKKLPDNSVDSVVTDPPYGLSFMNKKWDHDVPSVEFWKEVYRVLKPGGHVLSFGGTRTYHRMAVNIEDAGFEIRDQIQWLYGSGFPKSHNIGKAVDKLEGNEREVVGERSGAMNNSETSEAASFVKDIVGFKTHFTETKGTSPYEGWGTALKPANEPICVARKPLSEKSVAENVLKWGTGGINIDGCRIEGAYGSGQNEIIENKDANIFNDGENKATGHKQKIMVSNTEGRFPANIILDEVAAQMLDEQSGILKGDSPNRGPRKGGGIPNFIDQENKRLGIVNRKDNNYLTPNKYTGDAGASKFFYIPKVSKKERNMGLDGFENKEISGAINCKKCSICDRAYQAGDGRELCNCENPIWNKPTAKNTHPTIKPVQLMAYLCRLVTPPNGIILDPYMGSGSTGIAALLEGFRFCGMEMDEDYFKIAEARINSYEDYREFVEKKKK